MDFKHVLQQVEPHYGTAALVTGAACGVGALVILVQKLSKHQKTKEKVRRARARKAESLQRAEQAVLQYKESHPMTNSANILTLSLSELTKQLQKGSLSPEDVFYTYLEKALDVDKKLNCCNEILLDSFEQLKTISSNKKGLLYGVPVSIKENIAYKNYDSTCGVICNLEKPAEKDSVLVEVLKKQGAIPFVKTNVPQGLMNYDCSNPIYGQTLNPHNLKKTCGGSSGGEGALIGAGGSVLGIGTDIGGSIRIPSSFCGICGFKPTVGRLSTQGVVGLYGGQKSVMATAGPMGRDVDSLALCMQALLNDDMFHLDPTIPPAPFNMQTYQSSKPLRIGYVESDGFFQPSPSMARAVREVKALLEKAGHTLVPFSLQKVGESFYELAMKGAAADGAFSFAQKMKDSPLDPSIRPQFITIHVPVWVRRMLSFLLRPLSPRTSAMLSAFCGVGSIADLWKQHVAVEEYINKTIEDWRKSDIDVLLYPVIGPAFNFHYCCKNTQLCTYTMLFNVLNFPAGVVPVSTVTVEDEEELKHYKGIYRDVWDRSFKEAVNGAKGLPTAVQCVALPWQDELCLRFMKEVEQLVKQSKK